MTPYRSSRVHVLGSWMHYLDVGAGRPVLLLHGNPTSSFLWRHVLERAGDHDGGHRWIAPDLIGMGASGKPDLDYRLADHVRYVDAFVAALGLTDVVLVGHDWGVTIALDRLRRHPADVRGVAVMEGRLQPLPGWGDVDDGGRELFQRLREPGLGERLVLEENFFVDALLPAGLVRPLARDEAEAYAAPYPDPASRRPLLQWAREIPVAGDPADVTALVADAAAHLGRTAAPVLLVHGDPGVLVTAETVAWCRGTVGDLTVADVGGPAGHFLPEDRPGPVADALLRWVGRLP
ncbi:MAG: haloalkane dehalogenase() [uncultured Quadrisphaera sp.]|uniref:Haloalkane dehalogenase( ) n=1 Tax=uncultured Quadrisphaera sp. TaxID=904978 RepID=A0A6J4NNY4_9ACTN|nr:MAG: haloalkane dehalogenase() [uncultured Quadrisphaera sp.]